MKAYNTYNINLNLKLAIVSQQKTNKEIKYVFYNNKMV